MTDDEAAEIEEQLSAARRLVEVAEETLALVRAEPANPKRRKRLHHVIEGIEAGAVQLSAISSHLKSVQPRRPKFAVIRGDGERREREPEQWDQRGDEDNAAR